MMPYRRSRLHDYYEQLLGAESQPWLPSYIDPPVPPESRPEDTPGNDGSGPSELDESWLPSYIPDYPSPTGQSTEQGSDSDSGEQGSTGSSPTEDQPASRDANGETNAQAVPQDLGEGNGIDSVNIEAQIAAQDNNLLNEALKMCDYEGVPLILRSHPDIFLGLCADYGMDEEKDAEAKAHLAYWPQRLLGSDVRQHSTYNPTLKANELWVQAHVAFDPYAKDAAMEVTSYRAHLESTYGVTFTPRITESSTPSEKARSWDLDLLGLRSAHLAFEMLASVLGEWARRNGYGWDDATAFRRIMGDITLYNSLDLPPTKKLPDGTDVPTASAKVVGRRIQVFWIEGENRNFHLDPNVMLHELGHIYNANAGLGDPYSSISINETAGHPKTRVGMGSPDPDLYLRMEATYNPFGGTYPAYYQIVDVSSPNDKVFAKVPWSVPRRLLLLRQSPELTTNEITADAVLNLSYEQTSNDFGFTDTAEGKKWHSFMNDGMDVWNPSAIVYNAWTQGIISSLAEKGLISPISGTGIVSSPRKDLNEFNVRPTPSLDEDPVTTLSRGDEVVVLGESEPDSQGKRWIAVWVNGVHWMREDTIEVTWTDKHPMTEAESEQWFPKLSMLLAGR